MVWKSVPSMSDSKCCWFFMVSCEWFALSYWKVIEVDSVLTVTHSHGVALMSICTGVAQMTRFPMSLDNRGGPVQPFVVAHAGFNLCPGEILCRILHRPAQRFEQSLRNQEGDVVLLEADQPGCLFRRETRRWRGEVQEIPLLRTHGGCFFHFVFGVCE